jgi:hypothetical protein
MTKRADYTDDEWEALARSPLVAGFAISLADPGGPIELSKETMAAIKSLATPPSDEELLIAVSQYAQAHAKEHANLRKELDLKASTARQQLTDELTAVNGILEAKATPEEAAAFRRWLVEAAQKAADAAKEGGFLGIGATRVSEGELTELAEIRQILGLDPEG